MSYSNKFCCLITYRVDKVYKLKFKVWGQKIYINSLKIITSPYIDNTSWYPYVMEIWYFK